ncbi:MAG: hypothetical protein JNK48_23480, partial [Bryobacterales bacterium]|nr:hypothetical protein [Bryobacterales bacterium]
MERGKDKVVLVPVPTGGGFAGAVEEDALAWACGADGEAVRGYFAAARAPFEAALQHRREEGMCHIFYRPTVEGFEASGEDGEVTELFASIDPAAFLAHRETG